MSAEREVDLDLIGRYLSGIASPEEVRDLEVRLLADRELRRDFLCYAHADSALAESVRPQAQQPLTTAKPELERKVIAWPRAARWAAAALVMLGVGLAMVNWPRGVEVRVLEASEEARPTWREGSQVRTREVRLTAGTLKLQLASGVTLDLGAPTRLRLESSMHVILLEGAVTADSGQNVQGFTIETSSARAVDLGTRFGVSLDQTGATSVAVFKGKVEVHGAKAGAAPTVVSEGGAVHVHPEAMIRRMALITTRGDSFPVMLPPPPGSLVTDVSDNVADPGRYAFYRVQSKAMAPGVRPYTTLGKPRWQAMPGETFPGQLLGADVVGTFSPDRLDPQMELSITVSRPCVVFLMLDTRGSAPEWVRQEFTDTGLGIRCGPWAENPVVRDMVADQNGSIYVSYRIWKKVEPEAGTVKLGPAYPAKDGRFRAMYGVAVQELSK